ncbi:MAG: hypothetical protein Q7T03_08355 [Deltaproteobacteria bacterium]|nr:hypothetical protein [Deltaproteobacteria bacterium]
MGTSYRVCQDISLTGVHTIQGMGLAVGMPYKESFGETFEVCANATSEQVARSEAVSKADAYCDSFRLMCDEKGYTLCEKGEIVVGGRSFMGLLFGGIKMF